MTTWRASALCFGMHPQFDAPDEHNPDTFRQVERAKTICNRGGPDGKPCPVKDACFAEAEQLRDSGVRGGHLLHDGKLARVQWKRTA